MTWALPTVNYPAARRELLDGIAALRARVAELEKALEEAPHGAMCGYPDATAITIDKLPKRQRRFVAERGPCDCWKAAAREGKC